MDESERLHVEALRKNLLSFEEIIGRLNAITMQAPRGGQWDDVRDQVSCLDSIGDVMRQALDVLEGKWSDSNRAKGATRGDDKILVLHRRPG